MGEVTLKIALLDEDFSFEIAEHLFSFLLQGEEEEIALVKAELVREGVAFILFFRERPKSNRYRIDVVQAKEIGHPEIESRWKAKRDTLRTFIDARRSYLGMMRGETIH